jgi:hypothetical protein
MERNLNIGRLGRPPASRNGQRGVVLFIALIVMVALSLAGVALMRSVDTSTTVVGNLAFRQASIPVMNSAVEEAIVALFEAPGPFIPDKNADFPAQNYYASRQAGESANGIPVALQGPPGSWPGYPGGFRVLPTDASGNTVRYVIERMCLIAGVAPIDYPQFCDMAAPKVSPATTAMELDKINLGRVLFYRVTIRVDGPGNTVSFAQAMLR